MRGGEECGAMTIRPAKPDDVAGVLPMVAKICAFHEKLDPAKYGFLPEPARMYDGWLRSRAKDPRSVFLVAEREGTIAGFLVADTEREIGIYRLKEFGFVHDLWVEPEYRNEGLARQMVMLCVERFREIGVGQVRMDVANGNEAARRLFEACGFRVSTIEMLMELDPAAVAKEAGAR
jgi:ribosomal protein S18 acetylase RimI-like enzyme